MLGMVHAYNTDWSAGKPRLVIGSPSERLYLKNQGGQF